MTPGEAPLITSRSYFEHVIHVNDTFTRRHRNDLFCHYLANKSVLHVGFVDYPVTQPQENLHVVLSHITSRLVGYDLHEEGAALLKPYLGHGKDDMYQDA
jgi:hypothetical protein